MTILESDNATVLTEDAFDVQAGGFNAISTHIFGMVLVATIAMDSAFDILIANKAL